VHAVVTHSSVVITQASAHAMPPMLPSKLASGFWQLACRARRPCPSPIHLRPERRELIRSTGGGYSTEMRMHDLVVTRMAQRQSCCACTTTRCCGICNAPYACQRASNSIVQRAGLDVSRLIFRAINKCSRYSSA
jgi:hypothetical protein